MDQDQFRETYREVNDRACVFEKSVLISQCACSQAERFCIAEREGVKCLSDEGHNNCVKTLNLIREHARFALRTNEDKAILPHGKAMRVQVGGMRGIRALIEPSSENPDAVPDVYGILIQAIDKFESLEQIPYSEIMPTIAAYKGKTRAKKGRRKDK